MPTHRLSFHHLALLLVVGCLTVVGCVRGDNVDQLDAIKRPKNQSVAAAPVADEPLAKPKTVDDTPDNTWFRPRSSWSAQPIDGSNIDPMVLPIYRITIHHSGDAEDASGDPAEHLRQFERAHKAKGWACIGYHFVIARDGTVFEARPITYQGAHATGDNNIGNIGICLLGNFDDRPIPPAQRKSLEATVDRLRKQYHIKNEELFGHRDFKTTLIYADYAPSTREAEWVEAAFAAEPSPSAVLERP